MAHLLILSQFCDAWGIDHKMSSPYYPKSNELVERTIGSVKNIFKKCAESKSDVYLGLLLFRNTPKSDGISSPANLLMSRNLRCNLPISELNLKPKVVSVSDHMKKIDQRQSKMKLHYDRGSRNLPKEQIGERVLFEQNPQSNWVPATVVEEVIPDRSYNVKALSGVVYQRNREHILKSLRAQRERYQNFGSVSQSSGSTDTDNKEIRVPVGRPIRNKVMPKKYDDFVM